MKRIAIALILTICILCVVFLPACKKSGHYKYKPLDITVRYLKNIPGEKIEMSSGREVIAENTVFDTQSAKSGEKLTPPQTTPTREGYVFVGWAVDKEGTTLYDFDKEVTGSLNLYAKWGRSTDAEIALDYSEPKLSFEEKIDDSKGAFLLTGVCNQPIVNGVVKLTTVGINRLTHGSSDVKAYLNYTRASSTTVNSATYEAGVVTVKYTASGVQNTVSVTVNDISASLKIVDASSKKIDESTFETKARRYEDPLEPGNSSENFDYYGSYEVIMGGSSSMENWSASSEYMLPATTKNVGIGGSSAAYWRDNLADRLIIPFNPRAVILYVGINDIINYGQNGKTTANNLKGLFRHIHECLPDATIHYILINKVPQHYTGTNATYIDQANNAIIEFAADEGKSYMNIIDAGTVLEKKSKEYSWGYFLSDGLHMSLAGYELWGAEVKKSFVAKEKEIYNG